MAKMGRPVGAISTMTRAARESAKATGLLPHEWLLKVMRGEAIPHTIATEVKDDDGKVIGYTEETRNVYPSMDMRQDAAKAAAPFYAPKLAAQVIDLSVNKMTDEELDEELTELAAALLESQAITEAIDVDDEENN